MSNLHESGPWAWHLHHEARRVGAADMPRWLAVEQGRVWLTKSDVRMDRSRDIVLQQGQRQWLAPGSEWVAEGWPVAEIVVLDATPTQD